jgi:hypothetical protein
MAAKPVVLFLGAGFSAAAGLPQTAELFAQATVPVDTETRAALLDRSVARYARWKRANPLGHPEQYLADIRDSAAWYEAVRSVALTLTLTQGAVQWIGRAAIVKHQVNRTTGSAVHEGFWDAMFAGDLERQLTVVTTNYDVMAERGLRHEPRPRRRRPGFHYGSGLEELAGGGFPAHRATDPVVVRGSVPLLKLHGSLSWAIERQQLVRYRDLRPGVRGDAAIVAPGAGDRESWLEPIWQRAAAAFSNSPTWIFIGYSFPSYDLRIRELLMAAAPKATPNVYVSSAHSRSLADELGRWLPAATIVPLRRVPAATAEIGSLGD